MWDLEHKRSIKNDLDEIENFLDLEIAKLNIKLNNTNNKKQKSSINGYSSDVFWTVKTAYKNTKRAIEKFINEI